MIVDKNQKRLRAIKEIYPRFIPRECKCCRNEYIKEPMFKVNRWGVWSNGSHNYYEWNYCQHCTPTKEDVLNEIDTDECIFGIAFVDRQTINKTDYVRMNKVRDMMTGKL